MKADHPHPDSHLIRPPAGLHPVERLKAIVHRLRAPGGCPWDAEQTHHSLIPNLLEETYEVLDTIRRSDHTHLCEELGDLLLQVVFHAELGDEAGLFDLEAVATAIGDKLVRRHPHVFAESDARDTESVLRQWDAIKKQEKGGTSVPTGSLHDVGKGLPALLRAAKLQKKAAKAGFDWPDTLGALDKLREETDEVADVLKSESATTPAPAAPPLSPDLQDELGDLLFSVVNVVRKAGGDPEALLDSANRKFEQRYHAMENALQADGLDPDSTPLETKEQYWQQAKKSARS